MSYSRSLASLLTVAVFLSAANAAVLMRQTRATCPVVTTKPDFDYIPYAGQWYENQRFENVFQSGSTCIRAIYEEIAPGVVSVLNTGVASDGSLISISGSATPISPEEPGHLIVSFPGRPDGDYLVLDTDYVNYSSVYACDQAGAFALEYAWLLSREQVLPQEIKDLAVSKYEQFGIDINTFQLTPQGGDCVYEPEYPPAH